MAPGLPPPLPLPSPPSQPMTPLPPPKPTRPTGFWPTVRFMAQTRKGIGSMAVAASTTIMSLFYVLGLTVSYFRGALTPDAYWTKLQMVGGGLTVVWTALGLAYNAAIAYEDGQEKAGPQNVNVAESQSTTTDTK